MRILVACECSGRVRDAFLALGHDAISCDIAPSETTGPHHQGDVRELLEDDWDAVIAFPPCTYLSYVARANQEPSPERLVLQKEALAFAQMFWYCPAPRVAIENPQGLLNSWRKPTQIINPWMFGEPIMKRTCLWLRGLPRLLPTKPVEPDREKSKKWFDSLGDKNRPVNRSKTFRCVASAMASQWSEPDRYSLFPLVQESWNLS